MVPVELALLPMACRRAARELGAGIEAPFGTKASVIISPFVMRIAGMPVVTSWGVALGLDQTLATRRPVPGVLLVVGHACPLR